MNDETVLPTEVPGASPGEQFTEAYQNTDPAGNDDAIQETVATEAIVVIDYTPVIYDATSVLATVILAGALMIVGCLMAFKLWEVPHK